MSLLRFLGLGDSPRQRPEASGETETVRRIAARLERLPPERARLLAAFAYVLARVAQTDMRIDEAESVEMERRVTALADLTPEEAALAVEIAKSHARLLGGTENYVVTREFKALSTPEQRVELISCLFAVAAADGSISSAESNQITAIADELGLERDALARLRGEWRHKLGVLQGMPRG